jgi:hypothetical protein
MRATFGGSAPSALLAFALAGSALPAFAWVYPEHRDIAVLSVNTLDPDRKVLFDKLWREARVGYEKRLCANPADTDQGTTPDCIDWAALPAIAGDHSCSAKDMTDVVLNSTWILGVADVSAQLKVDLSRIAVEAPYERMRDTRNPITDIKRQIDSEKLRAERVNALRTADTRLQRTDPDYATRAGSNNAHFLLARPRTDVEAQEYAALTLKLGSEINAVGVYGWYHLSALQKASRLATESLTPEERAALTRAMFADEAFAIHFLEDMYASGHVAGTWGDASQRKGTHDYYNANGLEAFTWAGGTNSLVLMGDAHMRPEDAERTAVAVRISLEQVLDTATGRQRPTNMRHTPGAVAAPDDFDVCKNDTLPMRPEPMRVHREAYVLAGEVLAPTPVPSLGQGLGAMPRFRAEVGPFLGIAGMMDARYTDGGFLGSEQGNGWIGGVDLSFRAGLGLDGVLNESGDGLVFASIGLRGDSPSTNKYANTELADQAGNLAAAIPARVGLSTRLRMPYYLIPGDLLLAAPLYFLSPKTYQSMAVAAGNGGALGLQNGWATRFGRFQFMLGREIGATFYGLMTTDTLVAPSETPGGPARFVNFKSTFIDVPILEYRPYRSFDTTQSSELVFQLFAGADIPYGENVSAPPGAANVPLKTVYSIGLRLVFDWRRYY